MTIPFTGTGGLYTRIGVMGQTVADINTLQGTTLPADVQGIEAEYGLNNDEAMIDGIEGQLAAAQNSVGSFTGSLQSYATNTVNTMVYQDNPLLSNQNINTSLQEVIRQMKAASQTVKACTIGATVTAGTNVGNGVCVASVYRSDGLIQQNAFEENISVRCSADSTSNSSLAGREVFAVQGTVPYQPFDWRFVDGGSGGNTQVQAIDGTLDNNGNLLTNSDFETWTVPNVPNQWAILVGTAGTTVKESTSEHFTGSASLNFVGNGSQLTSIAQTFSDRTNGTAGALLSQTQYACNLWLKVDSVPSAGRLEVSLVDGSNTIIVDEEGNSNSFAVALSGATTSWVAHSGTFRTPYVLPDTIKLRVRLNIALDNAVNLFVDTLALGLTTQVYAGGPSVAVFSGSDNFYKPDNFTAAITNDRGGASNGKTFQTLYNRMFGMSQLGLLLPYSGSPTISDSLIA